MTKAKNTPPAMPPAEQWLQALSALERSITSLPDTVRRLAESLPPDLDAADARRLALAADLARGRVVRHLRQMDTAERGDPLRPVAQAAEKLATTAEAIAQRPDAVVAASLPSLRRVQIGTLSDVHICNAEDLPEAHPVRVAIGDDLPTVDGVPVLVLSYAPTPPEDGLYAPASVIAETRAVARIQRTQAAQREAHLAHLSQQTKAAAVVALKHIEGLMRDVEKQYDSGHSEYQKRMGELQKQRERLEFERDHPREAVLELEERRRRGRR